MQPITSEAPRTIQDRCSLMIPSVTQSTQSHRTPPIHMGLTTDHVYTQQDGVDSMGTMVAMTGSDYTRGVYVYATLGVDSTSSTTSSASASAAAGAGAGGGNGYSLHLFTSPIMYHVSPVLYYYSHVFQVHQTLMEPAASNPPLPNPHLPPQQLLLPRLPLPPLRHPLLLLRQAEHHRYQEVHSI